MARFKSEPRDLNSSARAKEREREEGGRMGEGDERKRKRWRCGGKGKGWEREKGVRGQTGENREVAGWIGSDKHDFD